MKTFIIKYLSVLSVLLAGLGLMLAGRAVAQTFTTLHSFTVSDGDSPIGGVMLSSNTLYGTTQFGGTNGNGTVFAVNINGTGFTVPYTFTALDAATESTNSDGADSKSPLILLSNTLYGTASEGGTHGNGTVFAVNTNGKGFTVLHAFTAFSGFNDINSDGANPQWGFVLSGNTLYGTAFYGGSSGEGTLFAVNVDGTGFTNLYSFTGGSDGANPSCDLILSGNMLYGTAVNGGSSGKGTVFKVNTNGTGFTTLHSFTATTFSGSAYTNGDGAFPEAGLILSGNTLYGTAYDGGANGNGTVFAVNTNGTGFTVLHAFTALDLATETTNSDGANPECDLILAGDTLYGTTVYGGSSGEGTVFAVNTNDTGFTVLHTFTAISGVNDTNSDGAYPYAGLILSGNTLYGTASAGGSYGYGTVFSLSLPLPQLTIISAGANVILTWPTNATGFTLEFATNLVSPTIWNTNSTKSVVISRQNVVINPITGPQMFFRLSQ